MPLICLETALPAKFAATIREALGPRPAATLGVSSARIAAAAFCDAAGRRRRSQGVHRRARAGVRTRPCDCHHATLWRDFLRNLRSGLRVAFGLARLAAVDFRVNVRAAWCWFSSSMSLSACLRRLRCALVPSRRAVASRPRVRRLHDVGAVADGRVAGAAFRQPHLRARDAASSCSPRAGAERAYRSSLTLPGAQGVAARLFVPADRFLGAHRSGSRSSTGARWRRR